MRRVHTTRRRGLPAALALLLVGTLLTPMHAHNVAVTHPEISDVAFETFRQVIDEELARLKAPSP